MEYRKIRIDQELVNLMNGSSYKVTGSEGNYCAVKLDRDKKPVFPLEQVLLNPETVPAFALLEDPNPPEKLEGYSAEDGVLKKDDMPVTEQGELYIKGIIDTSEERVLLSVRPRDPELEKKGYIDLFSYTPDEDRFNKILRASIPAVTVDLAYMEKGNSHTILSYSDTWKEEKENEKGEKVEAELFGSAAIMIYDPKRDRISDSWREVPVLDGIYKVFVEELDSPCPSYHLIYHSDKSLELSELFGEKVTKPGKSVWEHYVVSEGFISMKGTYEVPADARFVMNSYNGYVTVDSSEERLVQVTGDSGGFYLSDLISIKGPVLRQLQGYDTLVGKADISHGTRLTFADQDMKCKSIEITTTKDRGRVIKVL